MTTHTIHCPDCNLSHSYEGHLSFREECENCAHDLHICLTCDFHDQYVENQCREPTADPVNQKDRRNLCEYWKPVSRAERLGESSDDAKAKLHALFGEKGPTSNKAARPSLEGSTSTEVDEAKRKLEELFKK